MRLFRLILAPRIEAKDAGLESLPRPSGWPAERLFVVNLLSPLQLEREVDVSARYTVDTATLAAAAFIISERIACAAWSCRSVCSESGRSGGHLLSTVLLLGLCNRRAIVVVYFCLTLQAGKPVPAYPKLLLLLLSFRAKRMGANRAAEKQSILLLEPQDFLAAVPADCS